MQLKTQIQTKRASAQSVIPNLKINLKPIDVTEGPVRYKITGHTIPSAKMTAEDVMKHFGHDFREDGEGYLTILAKDGAHIELSPDTRHGKKGFRANRYELVDAANQKREWDEWPMFFETLDQAIALFALPIDSGSYEKQKRDAVMRF